MRTVAVRACASRIRVVGAAFVVAAPAVACAGGGTSAKMSSPATATISMPAHSTSAKGRPVADDPCAAGKGKYGGRIIRVFPAVGVEAGKPEYHGGGALQVWRSVRCGTVWAKMIRSPEETRRGPTEGSAGVAAPDYDHPRQRKETFTEARWSFESPALRLPSHARFEVRGGYVGMYQYEAGGKLHL